MNDLLPVLQANAAPMSLCSICPQPGRCCTGFNITGGPLGSGTYWESNWREQAEQDMKDHGLPFKPIAIEAKYTGDHGMYGDVRFSCPKVTADGRCGIYESRPALCRRFLPASNGLCVMKGIA